MRNLVFMAERVRTKWYLKKTPFMTVSIHNSQFAAKAHNFHHPTPSPVQSGNKTPRVVSKTVEKSLYVRGFRGVLKVPFLAVQSLKSVRLWTARFFKSPPKKYQNAITKFKCWQFGVKLQNISKDFLRWFSFFYRCSDNYFLAEVSQAER